MKYILAILCLILSATIFYQFRYYSNYDFDININSNSSFKEFSAPAANKALKPIRAYSEIIERPLFSNNRKPPEIISDNVVELIDISELSDLSLYGVVISNNKHYAIINDASEGVENIEVGHIYKGWNVSEINVDSVMFVSAKGEYELFISPNESENNSGIKKSYRNSVPDNPSANIELRSVIFENTNKAAKSPIKIVSNPSRNESEDEELTQEELELLDELGEEGGYSYDIDEFLGDDEDLEE